VEKARRNMNASLGFRHPDIPANWHTTALSISKVSRLLAVWHQQPKIKIKKKDPSSPAKPQARLSIHLYPSLHLTHLDVLLRDMTRAALHQQRPLLYLILAQFFFVSMEKNKNTED
jgi:hypothetical protein